MFLVCFVYSLVNTYYFLAKNMLCLIKRHVNASIFMIFENTCYGFVVFISIRLLESDTVFRILYVIFVFAVYFLGFLKAHGTHTICNF